MQRLMWCRCVAVPPSQVVAADLNTSSSKDYVEFKVRALR